MMRSVSFVDRVELDFSGNHFSHALALADVDGDGVRCQEHNTDSRLTILAVSNNI